jgi:structural maintenance of chromosome 2
MEIEQKDCSSRVDKLMEKYTWIATEKQLFGRSGTDYDFDSCEPRKAREELENLQAQQSGYIFHLKFRGIKKFMYI